MNTRTAAVPSSSTADRSVASRLVLQLTGAFCLATALATGSVAHAASGRTDVVVVRTHDLDLSSAAGAHALLRRLERAADTVCNGSFVRQYRPSRRRYVACYDSAMTHALAQLDAPLVQERHAQRSEEKSRMRRTKVRTAADAGEQPVRRQ